MYIQLVSGQERVVSDFQLDSSVKKLPYCHRISPMVFRSLSDAHKRCNVIVESGCCCSIKRVGRTSYQVGVCEKPCPTVSPSPSPSPSCKPRKYINGWVAGDPHIRTYDGLRYDCHRCGEFDISQSPSNPRFQLQGRFTFSPGLSVATVSDAVLSHDSAPKIQVSITRKLATPHRMYYMNRCRISFFVDGVVMTINPGTSNTFSGATVVTTNNMVTVTVPGQMKMTVRIRMFNDVCILDVTHSMWLPCHHNITGLLGNADGIEMNDWFTRSLVPVSPIPSPNGPARDIAGSNHCESNWKVPSASASLFTYETGLSYATIASCGLSSWNGLADRMEADSNSLRMAEIEDDRVPNNIARICGGVHECITDGKYGGEEAAREMLGFIKETEQQLKK